MWFFTVIGKINKFVSGALTFPLLAVNNWMDCHEI